MAGTTRLELATSAVTVRYSAIGLRRISRLEVRLSAPIGLIGQGWLAFVQRFVQPLHIDLPHADMNRRQAPFVVLGTILNIYTCVAPNNSRLEPPRRAATGLFRPSPHPLDVPDRSGSHPSSRTRSLRIYNNQFESSGASLACHTVTWAP